MLDFRGKNQVVFQSFPQKYMFAFASEQKCARKGATSRRKSASKKNFFEKSCTDITFPKKYYVAPVETFFPQRSNAYAALRYAEVTRVARGGVALKCCADTRPATSLLTPIAEFGLSLCVRPRALRRA